MPELSRNYEVCSTDRYLVRRTFNFAIRHTTPHSHSPSNRSPVFQEEIIGIDQHSIQYVLIRNIYTLSQTAVTGDTRLKQLSRDSLH